ncbi:MAG: hypothetical protein KAV44_07075 [Bacteroidales bacterium]|nr:hypothetical protein [Bacteroidales bacterium]
MNNTGLLSFNYLYEEAEKDFYYKIFKNKIERLSNAMASKFYNFCNKIFEREEESLNIDESLQDCDLLVKARTFFWEINKENSVEEEGTIKKDKISSGFFTELSIKLYRQIILFFEFDDLFFNNFVYSFQYSQNNLNKTPDLNNRFKQHVSTKRVSNNKVVYFIEYLNNLKCKKLISDKKQFLLNTLKYLNKLIRFFIEINDSFHCKPAYIYLFPKHFVQRKNYDMRFN